MSPYRLNLIRKRRSDDESSESDEDDLPPPVKKQRSCNGDTSMLPFSLLYFKNILHSKYLDCVSWMSKLPVNKYFRMSLLRQASVEAIDGEDEKNVIDIEEEIAVILDTSDPEIIRESRYTGDNRGQRSFLHSGGSRGSNGFPKPLLASTPFFTDGSLVGLPGVQSKKANGFHAKAPKSVSSRRNKQVDHTKKPLSNPELDVEILLGPTQVKTEDSGDLKIIAETTRRNRPTSSFKRQEDVPVFDVPSTSDRRVSVSSASPSKYFSSGTCHEVVRLQEKATYKLLLDEMLFKSQYRPVKTTEKAAIQVDLTQDEEEETVMKCHYSKEILQKPVEDYMKKYHKPCQLVKKPFTPSISKEESEPEMIPSDFPQFSTRLKEKNSALFSDEWIKEMRRSVNEETEKRLRLVSQQEDMQKRYRERREAKLQEDKRLFEKFKVPGDVFLEPSSTKRDDYPDLTPEMDAMVSAALQKYVGNENDELSSFSDIKVTRKMIWTLQEGAWLMDEVLNFFLELIVARNKTVDNYPSVYVFNTFFYAGILSRGPGSVLRWTRRVDIFAYDLLFVPLHLGMHWALCVVDNRKKTVKYYDSMGTSGEKCLDYLPQYLVLEMWAKKNIRMDPNEYSTEHVADTPQQMNGSDCGVFTMRYAEYVSRDAPITFNQAHMNYFRRRTVYEVLTKQIL